jgi:very-short-patch-repair endonuclease
VSPSNHAEPPPCRRGMHLNAIKYKKIIPLTRREGLGEGEYLLNKMTTLGKVFRKRPTNAEQLLWKHLRLKQMEGFKFRRQQPIDNYIVDFVCLEKRIVVEVDGGQHATQNEEDIVRDTYLQQQGFYVLRFWNNEVLQNINGVLEDISDRVYHPPLNPLPQHAPGRRQGRGNSKLIL